MKNYINFHTNYKLITSSSYRHLYSFAVKYPTQRFKTPITFPGARKEFGGALLKQNVIFHGQLQIKTSPANSFNSSCVWQCWLNETPHPEQGKLILHIIAVVTFLMCGIGMPCLCLWLVTAWNNKLHLSKSRETLDVGESEKLYYHTFEEKTVQCINTHCWWKL